HLQQLDFEDESFVWPNGTTCTALTVGQVRWDVEHPLGAFLHELERFRPTGDHAVHWELRRFAALDRAVEFRTVDQGSAVMHGNGIGGLGALAAPLLHYFVLQTTRKRLH